MNRSVGHEGLGYRSLQDILRTRLRDAIVRGAYAPGERLNINILAREFAVSAVPVREALRALEAEGFVEFSPNRGAVVASLSSDEVREVFLIRIPLEQLAVAEAIPRLSDADFKGLEAILDAMEAEQDSASWLDLNREFHLALYRCACLPRLQQTITLLWTVVRPYLSIFAARKTEFTKDEREHRALIRFCRRKDVSRARQVIDKHLADTRDMVLTTIAKDAQAVQQRKPRARAVAGKVG